jgi:putative transposase
MRRIDEQHLQYPFAGSRMLRGLLKQAGHPVGHSRIRTLMRKMGIDALYRKPNTSRRHKTNQVQPYLLRDLPIVRSNQAWAAYITDIPIRRGFAYLIAVLDWYSRRVLSWRLLFII